MLAKICLVLSLGAVRFAEVGSLSKVVVALQDQSLVAGVDPASEVGHHSRPDGRADILPETAATL
jgi:hypothetical protein